MTDNADSAGSPTWAHRFLCRIGLHLWNFSYRLTVDGGGVVHRECLACGTYDEDPIGAPEMSQVLVPVEG